MHERITTLARLLGIDPNEISHLDWRQANSIIDKVAGGTWDTKGALNVVRGHVMSEFGDLSKPPAPAPAPTAAPSATSAPQTPTQAFATEKPPVQANPTKPPIQQPRSLAKSVADEMLKVGVDVSSSDADTTATPGAVEKYLELKAVPEEQRTPDQDNLLDALGVFTDAREQLIASGKLNSAGDYVIPASSPPTLPPSNPPSGQPGETGGEIAITATSDNPPATAESDKKPEKKKSSWLKRAWDAYSARTFYFNPVQGLGFWLAGELTEAVIRRLKDGEIPLETEEGAPATDAETAAFIKTLSPEDEKALAQASSTDAQVQVSLPPNDGPVQVSPATGPDASEGGRFSK